MININSATACPESITITKGKWYYGANAEVCSTDATNSCVTWHSSNSNIASVNELGHICGVSEGAAVIYATAQDGSGAVGFCSVTVNEPIMVSSITVTPEEKTVKPGDKIKLSATVYPENAEDKRIRWTACNLIVAEVDDVTGCVTAKNPGTTCICANAVDGSEIFGCCFVTVESVPVTGIHITSNTSVDVGDKTMVTVEIFPKNATNRSVKWSSSDSTVASVGSINGMITGKKPGIATITAKTVDGGYESTCEVWVRGKTPVFLIHGRTSNSFGVWGAETYIKDGENDHYDSNLYAWAENDNQDVYVDRKSQRILSYEPDHEEGGNLAYYLAQRGYSENLNLFVFNYPNEDPVVHDAKKFEKYVENLIAHVRENGTDRMKVCFYGSRRDYEENNYKFNIVAHSMGGLVSRYYIENLGHDKNVDKLITICTPHWGSGYADASCITGVAHKICDHDLRFDSAMYGGDFSTALNCNAVGFNCYNGSYLLTDELKYSLLRNTKYYAIAGIDYFPENSIDCDDPNNIPIENAEMCTTYSQLYEYIQAQNQHGLYIDVDKDQTRMYMNINDVGDNMVGFLSQIGWTEQVSGDTPAKQIRMEKIFIIVDTNGGNFEPLFTLHNRMPHRVVTMDKVYEYLNT